MLAGFPSTELRPGEGEGCAQCKVGLGQVPLDKAAIAFCACPPDSAVRTATKGASPGTALPAGEWETVQLRGCWRAGQTAGGSRNFASYPCNPCLPFSVPEGAGPRYIRITLHQHCRLSDSQLHPIGFHIFQVSWVRGEASCCDTGSILSLASVGPAGWPQERLTCRFTVCIHWATWSSSPG